MNPRVSVIIPCYNSSEYIRETLDSVLAQTYRDFEVILINDGSPDTTELERVLEPYWDKIVYLRKGNGGVSSARNHGIAAARGELIATIDSDDIWTSACLEHQVAMLDADSSADIVYPNAVLFGEGHSGKKTLLDIQKPIRKVTFTALVTEECTVVTSVLARKAALVRAGLYDEQLSRCEDFDLWLRCVKSGSRIIYHHEVLLRYRRRPGSLSADLAVMAEHARKVLLKTLRTTALTEEETSVIRRKLDQFEGNRLFFEGKRMFLEGDYAGAIQRLTGAGTYLKNRRIAQLIFLIRTAPRLTRVLYRWMIRTRLES